MTGKGHKGPRMAGQRLAYALDRLSKNALIDLVADRARAEIGEDASEEALADAIQEWANPVLRIREDRPVFLRGAMDTLDRLHGEYMRRNDLHRCAHAGCEAIVKGGDLCDFHSLPVNRMG